MTQRAWTIPIFSPAKYGISPREEIGRRDEIGVEDRDELAPGDLEAGLECAGLIADAVRPVVVLDVVALRGKTPDGKIRDATRLVRRIVEHLNFKQLARILRFWQTASISRSATYIFVVQRQLNRDHRHRIERRAGLRCLSLFLM